MPARKTPRPRRTFTDEQKSEALALIQTIGYRATSRKLGIAPGTLSKWGKKAGIKSPRTDHFRAACEYNAAKNAARRAALAGKLLVEAEDLIDRMHKPSVAYNFGGKDNTYTEHQIPEPSFRDKQAMMTSAAIAIDKSLILEKHDSDDAEEVTALREWLKTIRNNAG